MGHTFSSGQILTEPALAEELQEALEKLFRKRVYMPKGPEREALLLDMPAKSTYPCRQPTEGNMSFNMHRSQSSDQFAFWTPHGDVISSSVYEYVGRLNLKATGLTATLYYE